MIVTCWLLASHTLTLPPWWCRLLFDHSLTYALARGLPGLLNFVAIAVYTRLLVPDAYGDYSLVIAGVALLDSLLNQWLRLGLLRFLPKGSAAETAMLQSLRNLWLRTALLVSAAVLIFSVLPVNPVPVPLLFSGLLLFISQGWFELNLELSRKRLQPRSYGRLALQRALLALLLGSLLAWLWGAAGLLLGLSLGSALAFLFNRQAADWSQSGLQVDTVLLSRLLSYGLPLTVTFALGFIVNSSDRFLIGWLLGRSETGLYSAGYDLASFSITMLLSIVNLAAYPLTVRALEEEGEDAARSRMHDTLHLLLLVGAPATAGLIILAGPVASLVVGSGFVTASAAVIPWIAAAAFLSGIKAYFVDVGFQLAGDTRLQAWVMLAAAALNVVLNLLLIPGWGIMGAVWSTFAVWALALLLSLLLVRRSFRLPAPQPLLLRPLAATTGFTAVLLVLPEPAGVLQLLGVCAAAGLAFALICLLLYPGLRQRLKLL